MARKLTSRAVARDKNAFVAAEYPHRSDEPPVSTNPDQHGDFCRACATSRQEFLSQDARIAEVFQLISLVANTNATVLITGETGTGKELIAREIVRQNRARSGSLITLNCAAIPETLQESELFGHVDGAFTGATQSRVGRFEAADGGTIFLDEISEMNKLLQSKLLRVLQSGEYSPVGSSNTRHCDVRVIAATNRNLEHLIVTHEFRADLYYRLNIICLEIPPLRDRRADIPLLAESFVRRYCRALGKPPLEIGEPAARLLANYAYPGNVRELENVIMRATLLARGKRIEAEQLPEHVRRLARLPDATELSSFHAAKTRAIEQFERDFLIAALSASGGLVNRAARQIGLSERNFHAKLKKYRMSGRSYRAG
jgi:transcriptional regulator with GAF, ATPase, and Fis domain